MKSKVLDLDFWHYFVKRFDSFQKKKTSQVETPQTFYNFLTLDYLGRSSEYYKLKIVFFSWYNFLTSFSHITQVLCIVPIICIITSIAAGLWTTRETIELTRLFFCIRWTCYAKYYLPTVGLSHTTSVTRIIAIWAFTFL